MDDRPAALRVALEQNWLHARHQENLRERQNYLYWVSWAAVLAYLPAADIALSAAWFLFGLIALFSAIVVSTSLKWTAEFDNHVTTAYFVAAELGLIEPAQPAQVGRLASLFSVRKFLSYPEFRGYMALPLDLPIFLNVGATMVIAQTLGLAVAIGIAAYGLTLSLLIGVALGIFAFGIAVTVIVWILRVAKARLAARLPANPHAG